MINNYKLDEIKPEELYKTIYREIGKAWSNSEYLMLRKQDKELEEGRFMMKGERGKIIN